MKSLFKSIVVSVLTWEAKLAISIHKPKIVAVTGNVGKTSTKDAIYTVLRHFYSARKGEKSFNSEIGVPLAILDLKNAWDNPFLWIWNCKLGLWKALIVPFPKVLVLEIGADRPGDISNVVKWLTPDVVVYTRMQTVPVHVENFRTPEDVFLEKSFLARALKHHGAVVINGDDEKMKAFTKGVKDIRRYGFGNEADVRGEAYFISYEPHTDIPVGITFRAYSALGATECRVAGVIGRHHAYPILAAMTVGEIFGMTPEESREALEAHASPSGRMKILKGEKCLIIDDTYNSSPVALEEALSALADLKVKGRKIAVMGDMKELGKYAIGEHRRLGVLAAKAANMVVAVGDLAKHFAESAAASGMPVHGTLGLSGVDKSIFTFNTSVEAAEALKAIVKPGDAVLVKGSQSMRMEHVVKALLSKDLAPDEHLVRQEREWERR